MGNGLKIGYWRLKIGVNAEDDKKKRVGLSAGPLRAKAGKTMPGCAAAGLLETLPEAWASATN